MYLLECDDEWNHIHSEDLWAYNKLFLSRHLGYICGPSGTTVPKPDFYIVRPSFNLLGMSRLARKKWIKKGTNHIHPAEFWCEIFEGEHISVDYHFQEQKLTILGTKKSENPMHQWDKWEKIDKKIEFPEILKKLKKNYEWINCEFIGNNLIEVHFRRNPDFRYGNSVAIPVWDKEIEKHCEGYHFIKDKDYKRIGFWYK